MNRLSSANMAPELLVRPSGTDCDLLVAGMGVHGLGIVAGLQHHHLLDESRFVCVDDKPPGVNWVKSTTGQGQVDLRSPWHHHVDPGGDPEDLKIFAEQVFPGETAQNKKSPSLRVFNRHLGVVAAKYDVDRERVSARITRVNPREDGRYDVIADSAEHGVKGIRFVTKGLILSTGLGRPYVPEAEGQEFLGRRHPLIKHASEINVDEVNWKDSEILIIGSAQTACTLAYSIAQRGGKVKVACRTQPNVTDSTEIDPSWFGGSSFGHYRGLDVEERARFLNVARPRANVSRRVYELAYYDQGVEFLYNTEVERFRNAWGGVEAEGVGKFDMVIYATGAKYDVNEMSYLTDEMVKEMAGVTDGLPHVTDDLQIQGLPNVWVSGRGAELGSGPGGRNIWGAGFARDQIVRSSGLAEVLGLN